MYIDYLISLSVAVVPGHTGEEHQAEIPKIEIPYVIHSLTDEPQPSLSDEVVLQILISIKRFLQNMAT